MMLQLESDDFPMNGTIPSQFTLQGGSVSPELHWEEAPIATREFALLCEDSDRSVERPSVHWLIYGIDAKTKRLPQGLPPLLELETPLQAVQGLNRFSTPGWAGPSASFLDGPHHYRFKLFALDKQLHLKPGLDRTSFLSAIENHVVEEASLVGTYETTTVHNFKTAAFMALGLGVVGLAASQLKSEYQKLG